MSNDFDPMIPETFDSPHEEYRRLRETCPVAHSETWGGFWALMKYEDVAAASADFRTFITSKQNVIPKVAFTGRRPPLHLDPPEHTHYRRALSPLLSEKRVARLEPVIRAISRELLHDMVSRGGGDIVADFSAPMPIATFANWMNLEPAAVAELTQVGRDYNIAVQSNDMDETKRSSLLLYDMARTLVSDRMSSPLSTDEDATSALLAARVGGEPLPEEMIVGTIRQVLVVGIIAPSVTIGSFVVHLARDRQLQSRLRGDPRLIPAAVEELLRLYSPYRGFARTAVCPVEFRGRTIPEGEPIAIVYASANRDADVFEDPDTFRLERDNIKDSLAFGRGPHACVGAALARLELKVALEEILAAAPEFTLAGEPVQTRFPEIGALSVPIRFGPLL
ncbi:MAG: cytochrome P450 [Croceibacterium sp.]